MEVVDRDQMPIVIDSRGVQIRARELGEMTILFYRFARGSDLRAELQGLPGDGCSCPHWAYVLRGKLRVHTADGTHDVAAGQAFHVEPGHYPEALEDTEMFEVSPAKELRVVGEHILRGLATKQRAAS